MNEWLEQFYNDPDLRASMLREYLPLFSNYVNEAVGPVAAPFVQALAESYVDRYLGSSRSQLQELVTDSVDPLTDLATRFDEWEQKRPEKVAKNELVRSANAAQVDQFRQAGVEKMVWRASGGACPFCREIDGVVISVNGTFFSEGDELAPEGVEHPIHFESSIGHPPVHQGCTCFVESFTDIEAVGRQVSGLTDRFGVPVRVVTTDKLRLSAEMSTTGELRLGKDLLTSKGQRALAEREAKQVARNGVRYHAVPGVQGLVSHEYGHAVANAIGRSEAETFVRTNSASLRNDALSGRASEFRPRPLEAFAEMFAATVAGDDRWGMERWILDHLSRRSR